MSSSTTSFKLNKSKASFKAGGGSSSSMMMHNNLKPKQRSWVKIILELIFFLGWMVCTGLAGYFIGHTPSTDLCPPTINTAETPVLPTGVANTVDYSNAPSATLSSSTSTSTIASSSTSTSTTATSVKCPNSDPITLGDKSQDVGIAIGATSPAGGFSYDEINRLWTCSRATADPSEVNQKIYPKEKNYDKTKWKSIITVEPKAFFDKYLSQYPGDVRAVQPVVVFSHKPLDNFDQLSEVCKVIDVAIVPDKPGVCVAVTETYHDVASYHMLHADRQPDGSFALTANSLEGKTLPDEHAYAAARSLLIWYFKYVDYVQKMLSKAPKYGGNKVVIGSLVESMDEAQLFLNSLESGFKQGISKNKFLAITTSSEVNAALKSSGVYVFYLSSLAGLASDLDIGYQLRRQFLHAWVAFALANNNVKVMWQSPGSIWFDRPDNIVNSVAVTEIMWAYKGRNDKRGAPFFVSFDFFVPTIAERPVHLLHEIMLHFDLAIAWNSLDAVAAYRLSENNSRYGTTTQLLPPSAALYTGLLNNDPLKVKDAVNAKNRPKILVVPSDIPFVDAQKMLEGAGLWFLSK